MFGDSEAEETEITPDGIEETPKKEGFLKKLSRILFGEDDEDEKGDSVSSQKEPLTGENAGDIDLSDPNMQILQELGDIPDISDAPKEEEKPDPKEEKKKKKEKKKKEKKPKKPKVKQPPKPGDIIRFKPKSIIVFVMLIVGIVVLVQMFGYTINYSGNISLAKDYYANQEYDKAYNSLDGIKLSGDDETLYKQAKVVMYVQRQYESYENYEKMNMHTEALNALVKGVDRYQTYLSLIHI